jgi:hypothetical protein
MSVRQSRQSALNWRKSSASAGQTECVEIARTEAAVLVRDSSDRAGTLLVFAPNRWSAFVKGIQRGDLDGGQQ